MFTVFVFHKNVALVSIRDFPKKEKKRGCVGSLQKGVPAEKVWEPLGYFIMMFSDSSASGRDSSMLPRHCVTSVNINKYSWILSISQVRILQIFYSLFSQKLE